MEIHTLPARSDNTIHVLVFASEQAVVVDPCDERIVSEFLSRRGLRLSDILVTHHHQDHVGGIAGLKEETGCTVYAPETRRIAGVDRVVTDGQEIACAGEHVTVLATPGHTQTSVCYALNPASGDPVLFTGDTLFVGGCGRLFECSAATMWESLQQLAVFPDETRIYCGHEYTRENLIFAETIDPGDALVQAAVAAVRRTLDTQGTSMPSTIGREKQMNIFLRAGQASVGAALGLAQASPAQVFTELRRRKDRF